MTLPALGSTVSSRRATRPSSLRRRAFGRFRRLQGWRLGGKRRSRPAAYRSARAVRARHATPQTATTVSGSRATSRSLIEGRGRDGLWWW